MRFALKLLLVVFRDFLCDFVLSFISLQLLAMIFACCLYRSVGDEETL